MAESEGTAMADGERQGAPGQAAESPEVAALLAKLASVTSAIHAAMDAGNGWVVGHSSVHYALSEMRRILYLATKEVLADDAPGRPGGEGEGR